MSTSRTLHDSSWSRILQTEGGASFFFKRFYEVFFGMSEEVRAKFANTDMQKQQTMLQSSFIHMEQFAKTGEASPYMEHIAARHSSHDLDIAPGLYDVWLQAVMITVEQCDPESNREVLLAWNEILEPGIEFMRSRYVPRNVTPGAT